ncbi:MAG: T9SS type B sorting domain-containing protein [Chlorobi bacterium]|nr:T9SS type B sorting domain-containing protein [Chlorobiota bacterium]
MDGIFITTGTGTTMSDTLGNFLFATGGENIYNRNKIVMYNGNYLKGSGTSFQGSIIVPKPESNNLYYVFTVTWEGAPAAAYGLYYSVVDMNLDNGLGGVVPNQKNILLDDAWDAAEKVLAVKHENGKDIWIITRKQIENSYAAFLLTDAGINTTAVISPSIERDIGYTRGMMKVSFDKKHLVAAYYGEGIESRKPDFEICNFNASSGEIELLYTVRQYSNENPPLPYEPYSIEFSPDSKLLYVTYQDEILENPYTLYQYDVKYYDDSSQFAGSAIHIASGGVNGLQLARDGKIYCTQDLIDGPPYYLGVINKPWKRGIDCDYESNVVDIGNKEVFIGLQNILLDYLYRFEWEGKCSAEPFVFQSNFIPEPVNIRWSFDDPDAGADSISFDLNPVHYFTHAGDFEVKVSVLYPSGRVEKTSRMVTVIQSPQPDLGPDTLMCAQGETVLDAGDEEGDYRWWHNGQPLLGLDTSQITVSDTGLYWVEVTNAAGCSASDTIHLGLFPPPGINEDNLQLIPTTCGGSTGKILGLQVTGTEPLSFAWYDADSTLLDTTLLNLINLPVGNYFLHILDGNGCTTVSHAYTIEDAGNIEITTVEKQNSRCGQNNGAITVTATSSGNLSYSIDNGATWQSSNVFADLPAGNYFVRAKDPSGCEGVYADNPVVIENIPGPQVTAVTTVPEIDNLSNGEINITATADTGQIFYSIDDGSSFQTDNGKFTNLSAGTYDCVVKDGFGCDTAFTVEVTRIISQLIEAIAGDGNTCIGNAAVVPLKLVNFKDIYKFHVTLTYDTAVLKADGYIKVNPVLEPGIQVSIIPGGNQVVISWQGDKPETLEDNATMLELVFGAKKEGLSGIDWAAQEGQSAFFNGQLEEVNAQYHTGMLRVYTRPEIIMAGKEEVCEGSNVSSNVFVFGGSGQVTYRWEGPDGYTSTADRFELNNVQMNQQGIYTLTVTDTIQCEEKKELNLIVHESPQIAFSGMDTLFAQPGFVLEAGSGYQSYLWNTGDTTDAIQVDSEGQYWVTVTSTESCRSADTVMVFWGGQPFYLPNAFTPNGDGLNDEFKPVQRYDLVRTYHLYVYNRWGQLIFETSDINTGWDGTYKGNPAEQGRYLRLQNRLHFSFHQQRTANCGGECDAGEVIPADFSGV